MDKLSERILKFRWLIIVATIGITLFCALQIPKAVIDPSVKNMLPPSMSSRINQDKIEDIFGGSDIISLMIFSNDILEPATLRRISDLSKKIKRIDGVDKVLSLFEMKSIKGEDGAMLVDPAVKKIPKNLEEMDQLRTELKNNDLVYGLVVSKDFKAAAILGLIKTDVKDDPLLEEINKIVKETPGPQKVVISGLPFTRSRLAKDIAGDMRVLMPIGIVVMLLFLFAAFKQLRGVLLPFSVVIMSIIVGLGLVPLLGLKITFLTILLPIMLVAIANDYGIHLIAHYQEKNTPQNNLDKKQLAQVLIRNLFKPIVVTGLTSIVGMLCLLGHSLVPAKEVGILAALSLFFALTASLLFIPSVLSLLPLAKPIYKNSKQTPANGHFLDRLLVKFSSWVVKTPKLIIVVMLIVTAFGATGIFKIVVDTNPEKYYTSESDVTIGSELMRKYFGGSANVSVVFKGDIKDPNLVKRIDDFENKLLQMPQIGHTTSIGRVIRQMSRALNDKGQPQYEKIPDTRNAISQYFELYSMSGDPEDFEKVVDFDYEHTQVTGRLKQVSTLDIKNVLEGINKLVGNDENLYLVGGFANIMYQMISLIVKGQLMSLALSLFFVSLMIMIQFRSITAGLISTLPLAAAMVLLFGLMGYLGIELNAPTAMLSSIMIGVGVDYTIHFLWRFREELANGLSFEDAIGVTLTTTGRGIIFNALSVIIGFVVLVLSNFLPIKFFGLLVVISIGSCLIGSILVIPALCLLTKPKFLKPKTV